MRLAALTAFAFFLSISSAHALSFTWGGDGAECGSCDGAVITLEVLDQGDYFDVTFILDSTDYDDSREGIVQVGFGAIKDWDDVELISSPDSSTVAWADPTHSNVDSEALCGGSGGNSGKICTSGFTDITVDDIYEWEFRVYGGRLKTDEWHIGGQYANYQDLFDEDEHTPNGRLISEVGVAVPEPTAAVVFAAGLLVVGQGVRRRS